MRVVRQKGGLEVRDVAAGGNVTVNDVPAGEIAPGQFRIDGDFMDAHAVLVSVNGVLHPVLITEAALEPVVSGFTVATYAIYDADIREFINYYREQGVSRMYVYVGRAYVPKECPQGDDITYIPWSDRQMGEATDDVQGRIASSGCWFAWVPLEERYYISRSVNMSEYLETVTPSFDVVRVQAHLARISEAGTLEYCKDALPWTTKCGFIRRKGVGSATLDSGVAKKLHLVTDPLPGTVYTVPRKS